MSKKGAAQAEIFKESFLKNFPEVTPLLFSSPKLRCIETLQPLAEHLHVPIYVNPALGEKRESDSAFEKRIRDFCRKQLRKKGKVFVFCSHGDWAPIAVEVVSDVRIELPKGAWAQANWGAKSQLREVGVHIPSA